MEVTFLVTALNEAENIRDTVRTIQSVDIGPFAAYRIVIVDDGSTDGTGQIADALRQADSRITVVHNPVNRGLGGAYREGLRQVVTDYVIWVSGDNAESATNLSLILSHAGAADIIVPVLYNSEGRPWLRRMMSSSFTMLVNFIFGLSLGYYNGTVLHRVAVIRSIEIHTSSFAYQAEALIKLLKKGHSYLEVPYRSASYDGMFSNALKPRNLKAVFVAIVRLAVVEKLSRLHGAARPHASVPRNVV